MIVFKNPPRHLTYCLNIHPGETWHENFETIKTVVLKIRKRVSLHQPFGLSLRLGHLAARELCQPESLSRFKAFIDSQQMYVFTVNGFPYGEFHKPPVKENVYSPDWRSKKRLDYTKQLADILSEVLPEGISGSISTVPGSYKDWITSRNDREEMIKNLMACVAHLSNIREKTGKEIHLGMEPEPDCFFETTTEALNFFTQDVQDGGRKYLSKHMGWSDLAAEERIRRHLGVCFDTCHMALQSENLAESIVAFSSQGIRISKIQLSAAIVMNCTEESMNRIKAFLDPVYLHQVKAYQGAKKIGSYRDLPDALKNRTIEIKRKASWRVHFHVPLYYEGDKDLQSTSSDLSPAFFKAVKFSDCEHFEIETYTFHVLPAYLRTKSVIQSVVEEYHWILDRFRA